MRGMNETYGMGAGASVRKGKTAKQVRRARKNIDAAKKKMSQQVRLTPALTTSAATLSALIKAQRQS
jgi:hypothetical protein